MELDLDYLEKRGMVGESREDDDGEEEEEEEEEEREEASDSLPNSLVSPDDYSPPETSNLVKIILLGAPAVGKTSIVQQFVWNDYCGTYYPTDRRHTYYPSVIINGRLYDLKISDLPPVPYFPVDSLLEWTDFRSYGLRSATAYVLVFDLSNAADTFRHIKCLREQMAGSRDMRNVPVLVVGNKHDRLHEKVVNAGGDHPPGSFFGVPCPGQSPDSVNLHSPPNENGEVGPREVSTEACGPTHANSVLLQQQQRQMLLQQEENAMALAETRQRREIANIVKKHWGCRYVECSAKYNWRVVEVFKELMRAVDSMEGMAGCVKGYKGFEGSERLVPRMKIVRKQDVLSGFYMHRHQRTPTAVNKLHDSLDRNKCEVL